MAVQQRVKEVPSRRFEGSLETDKDFDVLQVRKNAFARVARDVREYEKDAVPSEELLEKLVERDVDVLLFWSENGAAPSPIHQAAGQKTKITSPCLK